jgi:hypothetical protein
VQEVFALLLARKLNDQHAIEHYARLSYEHPDGKLVSAYRKAQHGQATGDLARRFHVELQARNGSTVHDRTSRVIALRIERRCVAGALLHGDHLEYTDLRQLSSDKAKAVSSALAFVNWLLDSFDVDSSAIELIPNGHEIQRQVLTDAIRQTLRDRMLPIWDVAKTALFEAFGESPLRSRREIREVITGMWPILAGSRGKLLIQDAVALGVYVQIERLFIN